jgi:SSS family solute:Na+ symporter
MQIFGLHWLDFSIVLLYLGLMVWLGKVASGWSRNIGDFYLAGRRLGRFYQFFLNLGSSTHADQAVAVSREVYRQGIGGMWIQFLVLLLTPFYWFTTAFFRRCRMITIGDYYTERFRSKFLGAAFAVFTLFMAFLGGGVGFLVAGKTFAALTPKPAARYTVDERRSAALFQEYQALRQKADQGLSGAERARYDELGERSKRGELKSFISTTNPIIIYCIYAVIVGLYIIQGGFFAAVLTDVVQGFLIIIFSVLLVPLALSRLGGFAGLHAQVPGYMFRLFGSSALSEYGWHTILAMSLANLVSIIASAPMMHTAGSAKDEMTARVGMLGGMFFKRFLMIFWGLAGLLAVGLYGGRIHDPDLIWGVMSHDLLGPGILGLMLAGILAASMSSLNANSVTYSALFIRNLYQPFVADKPERHYINVGRVIIAVTLLGSLGSALFFDNILDLFKYFIAFPAVFGASIWLGFLWRRLTKGAIIIQVFLCLIIYAVIPNVFQTWDWARHNPGFLLETRPRLVQIKVAAATEDVQVGLAREVGERISKPHRIEPVGIFYERVARQDPSDPRSPKVGFGRFEAEVWVLSLCGLDFTLFSKSQLVTTRFLFDALFPFFLLFLLSFVTRSVPREAVDRFFAKIHTPVQPTPEEDARAVAESVRRPEQFEKFKLKPGSAWEIMKPARVDLIGFFGSWLVVGLILAMLWVATSLR